MICPKLQYYCNLKIVLKKPFLESRGDVLNGAILRVDTILFKWLQYFI